MRRTIRSLPLLFLVVFVLVVGLAAPAIGGGATRVRIIDNGFRPRTVTIDRGTAVRWVNTGNRDHTTTGPGWDSGALDPGDTFRRRFNRRGTFAYRCTIHATMRGTIIVE
ncbi:MAG: cupredoxin domain-containing protein [Actinobacteria bacterium]|nr:cupredoxin domain-containing protein [Actinomycetota bacterium]